MCRNITILRGLQPAATAEEIEAAARQYVRKVSGVQTVSAANEEPFELAVRRVAAATTELLASLPPRKQPPTTVPPLRRIRCNARLRASAGRRPRSTGLATPSAVPALQTGPDDLGAEPASEADPRPRP